MLIPLNPEIVKQLTGRQVITPKKLPKHLKWTLPLMDETVKEVKELIDKPKKKYTDLAGVFEEIAKEMIAGKGE
jgi:hypothetical protein